MSKYIACYLMQSAYFPSLLRPSDASDRVSGPAMTGQNSKMRIINTLGSVELASTSYLADGAVVEEEEGADEGAQGAGDDAGTQPPQNAAQLQHGIAAGHHHQGRVSSCQLQVLHGRPRPFSISQMTLPPGHARGLRCLLSNPPS